MNSEIFAGLIGFVMPYAVEVIKAKLPKTNGKWLGYLLAYGLCVVVGGVGAYFEGSFNPENVLSSVGVALIASQGVYNLYFKNSKAEKIIAKKFS